MADLIPPLSQLYPQDRLHRMPIITPAYPSMCATHNVTQSTQMIMTQECKAAAEIVDRIIVGTATWKELFKKHDFFYKYKYYLQVIASSGSADLQLKWQGTVESRIRQLVMKLELVPTVLCAHPFIKGFDQISECHTDDEVRLVATGDVPEEVAKRTKLEELPKDNDEGAKEQAEAAKQQAAAAGHRMIWTTTFYIGLAIQGKDTTTAAAPGASPAGPRKLDISYPTTEFTRMVKQWEQFDDSSMGIVVRHIKCSRLPEYVFAGDEKPAAKPLKRSKTSKKNGGAAAGAGAAGAGAESQDAAAAGPMADGSPTKKLKGDAALAATNGGGGEGAAVAATATTTTPATATAASNGVNTTPVLPLQSATTAEAELENFKLATGGAVPAASSSNASDFRPA